MFNKQQRFGEKAAYMLLVAFLIIITIVCLAPIWHMVALSFSDKSAAAAGLVSFIPVGFTLTPYEYILQDHRFFFNRSGYPFSGCCLGAQSILS